MDLYGIGTGVTDSQSPLGWGRNGGKEPLFYVFTEDWVSTPKTLVSFFLRFLKNGPLDLLWGERWNPIGAWFHLFFGSKPWG